MIEKYEKKYNAPGANMKVDASSKRYANPRSEADENMRKRYVYSVNRLHGSVLDVGAGDGFGVLLMKLNNDITDITCLEIQDKAIEILKSLNHKVVKGIGEQMPFKDNSFDSVHCGHTLEHAEDDRAVLKEIARVARETAVISVPIMGGLNKAHLREYTSTKQVIDLVSDYMYVDDYHIFPRERQLRSIVLICKL